MLGRGPLSTPTMQVVQESWKTRETTNRGRFGLGCPSRTNKRPHHRTSERGGEVKIFRFVPPAYVEGRQVVLFVEYEFGTAIISTELSHVENFGC